MKGINRLVRQAKSNALCKKIVNFETAKRVAIHHGSNAANILLQEKNCNCRAGESKLKL